MTTLFYCLTIIALLSVALSSIKGDDDIVPVVLRDVRPNILLNQPPKDDIVRSNTIIMIIIIIIIILASF